MAGVYYATLRPLPWRGKVVIHDGRSDQPAQNGAATPAQPERAQATPSDLAVADAEVHAVGVYEGTVPADGGASLGGHRLGIVDVTVAVRDRPVVLVLTAYEPVHWRIGVAPGVQLMKVFAWGYYAPLLSGVPENVPITTRSHEVDRSSFYLSGTRSDEVLELADQLRTATGRAARTVQYAYRGKGFSVDGVSTLPPPGPAPRSTASGATLGISTRQPSGLGTGWIPAEPTLSVARPTATYCCAGAFSLLTTEQGYTIGKHYIEFTLRLRPGAMTSDLYTNAGIVSQLARNFGPNVVGGYAYPVVRLETPGRLKDGDVVGIAMDLDAARFYYHVNGVWTAGPPPQDGVAIAPGREYRAAVTVGTPSPQEHASDAWTANFGQTPFVFPVPRGFQPYGGSAGG